MKEKLRTKFLELRKTALKYNKFSKNLCFIKSVKDSIHTRVIIRIRLIFLTFFHYFNISILIIMKVSMSAILIMIHPLRKQLKYDLTNACLLIFVRRNSKHLLGMYKYNKQFHEKVKYCAIFQENQLDEFCYSGLLYFFGKPHFLSRFSLNSSDTLNNTFKGNFDAKRINIYVNRCLKKTLLFKAF